MTFDISGILAAVIVGVICIIPLKELKKEYLPFATAGLSLVLLGVAFKKGLPLFEYLNNLNLDFGNEYFSVLMKCFGIAVITNLTSQLCADFSVPSVSEKVDFVGKCAILLYSLPLVDNLLSLIEEML